MEVAASDPGQQPRFSAFLSYSHADAAAVRKLHAQLESYRLPKELGEVSSLNQIDRRLGQVFRDREDLSAAESLSDAVTAALDQSEVLVVVCSPDAKASRWVNQEIAYFRANRPGKPILAAVVRGEPSEALPDALTQGGAEPLAADLRKQGDGWKQGFLKVVSGIAGVPLDALIQRDSQRQTRRVMAVTGVSVLAALVMAIMTTVAIQARNEAQFQQAEAEGLVAYMLTDLRDDLRKVGSIDTMAGVSERALQYYEGQEELGALSKDSLLRRSAALHGLGEDMLAHVDGNIEQVLGLFEEAYRTTGQLYSRTPEDADTVFNHAQSAFWVGRTHYSRKDWPKTERYLSEYAKLAEEFAAVSDDAEAAELERGYALGNLCSLALHRTDKPVSALGICRKATDIVEGMAKAKPDDADLQSAWANRLGWLGDALKRDGNTETALETYQQQHAILEAIQRDDPDNATRIDQLMRAKMTLAEAQTEAGQRGAGSSMRAEALALANAMVRKDPQNARWQEWRERIVNGTK